MSALPELFDLSGRAAIVTGGAGLLGAEFCRTLAQAGAQVLVADIDGEAARSVAASLARIAPAMGTDQPDLAAPSFSLETDITSSASVRAMVEGALERFGRVDILVNSAVLDPKFDPQHNGLGQLSTAFEDYPVQVWRRALEINLTGLFLCCQACVGPMLKQGRGVIVNLCSIYGLTGPDQRIYQKAGQMPRYKPAHYSVAKAGVLGLTRYLATYYAGKNIRVNALTPGGVFNGHDEEFVQAYSARAVLGRMAEKDEMNGALLFLVSDASAYMTGANLVVDGGWTAW